MIRSKVDVTQKRPNNLLTQSHARKTGKEEAPPDTAFRIVQIDLFPIFPNASDS